MLKSLAALITSVSLLFTSTVQHLGSVLGLSHPTPSEPIVISEAPPESTSSANTKSSARIVGQHQTLTPKVAKIIESSDWSSQEPPPTQEELVDQYPGLTEAEYQALVEAYLKIYNDAYQNTTLDVPLYIPEEPTYSPLPSPEPYEYSYSYTPSAQYCASQKSYLDSHYQSQVNSENSRYQQEYDQLANQLAANGTYGGGGASRALAQVTIDHNYNLDMLQSDYNLALLQLQSEGCTF